MVVSLVASAGVAAWLWRDQYERDHVTIQFEAPNVSLPDLELTFYPEQLAFASPSPPSPIGNRTLVGAQVSVGRDLVPGRSVLRYAGEGVGAGVAYVQLGVSPAPITLRAPASFAGRVAEPLHYWCMGWRCAGHLPVADAEVMVMGGGEHGVVLASARTDAQGAFTVSGFDGELDALGLRVRAPGFELAHQSLARRSDDAGELPLISMSRAPPRRGRVTVAPKLGFTPQDVLLLARGLPGVQARPDLDGRVVLDHINPGVEARVIAYGLPAMAAQSDTRTSRDEEFEVQIVEGAVVTGRVLGDDLQPVPNAFVWIDQRQTVSTDAAGVFELQNLLPGKRRITAQWRPRRRRAEPWLASKSLTLVAGQRYERVELLLER